MSFDILKLITTYSYIKCYLQINDANFYFDMDLEVFLFTLKLTADL